MKKTRYVLLGLLQEEELSGYEMKKIIDLRMSFFWQESYGQIYPELSKLLEEGLVDRLDSITEKKSKREKIKYKITPKGEEEFRNWIVAENEKDTTRSEFLLKMFLTTDQNREEMHRHIVRFIEEAEKKLKLFDLFEAQLKQTIEVHHNHRQILSVLNLGIQEAKLYADWGREMLEQLTEK